MRGHPDMDAALIQQKIYKGRGKAALRIGLACNVFRPIHAATPLDNQITTLLAAFNVRDATYTKADDFGKAAWYADYDGTQTQAGDYLVRQFDNATWYVSQQAQLLPIALVQCERKIYLTRPPADAPGVVGALPYSGVVACGGDPDMNAALGTAETPWPCSILLGGRALNALPLPTSVKEGGWRIYLPPSVPIVIEASDTLIDDLGRRYIVESAELTDLGWRINANEAHD